MISLVVFDKRVELSKNVPFSLAASKSNAQSRSLVEAGQEVSCVGADSTQNLGVRDAKSGRCIGQGDGLAAPKRQELIRTLVYTFWGPRLPFVERTTELAIRARVHDWAHKIQVSVTFV